MKLLKTNKKTDKENLVPTILDLSMIFRIRRGLSDEESNHLCKILASSIESIVKEFLDNETIQN